MACGMFNSLIVLFFKPIILISSFSFVLYSYAISTELLVNASSHSSLVNISKSDSFLQSLSATAISSAASYATTPCFAYVFSFYFWFFFHFGFVGALPCHPQGLNRYSRNSGVPLDPPKELTAIQGMAVSPFGNPLLRSHCLRYYYANILPISTPITDAIIKPRVQPELSPRQYSPLILVLKFSSIFTRLL